MKLQIQKIQLNLEGQIKAQMKQTATASKSIQDSRPVSG